MLVTNITTGLVTLPASADRTVVMVVGGATHWAEIVRWEASFRGTDPTASHVHVKFVRCSTAGTMTAVAPTAERSSDTGAATYTATKNASVEPTVSATLRELLIHPQDTYSEQFPDGHCMPLAPAERLAIVMNAPVSVVVVVNMKIRS